MIKKLLHKDARRAAECVEAAITLPLLMIAMFSTISITHRWHVEKMMKLATFEAIKAGCASDGDADDAIDTFNRHAAALGIQDARLIISRGRFNNANTGQLLFARAVAPTQSNQFLAPINLNFDRWMSGGWIFYRKEGL